MAETLAVTYTKCAFCTAKNHCESCGAEIAAALLERDDITEAKVNIPDHSAVIVHTMDPDDLVDLLEGMGMFVD